MIRQSGQSDFGTPAVLRTRTGIGVATLLFLATAVILAMGAYYAMFGVFRGYDDEGYMLVLIDQFTRGGVFGDEVYSTYGPFYALFHEAVFRSAGLSVHHDAMRLLTMGTWLLTVLVSGVFVLRTTGNLLLSVLVPVLTLKVLMLLVNEPGHPQVLCGLLVLLLPTSAVVLGPGRRTAFCITTGVLVACLLMTKINLGVFAMAALVLAFAACTPGRFAAGVRVLTSIAVLMMPVALVRLHWSDPLALRFAVAATLSVFSVVLLHHLDASPKCLRGRDGVCAAVAGVLAGVAICAIVMLRGTSMVALLDTVLLEPLRHPTVIFHVFDFWFEGMALAVAGTCGCLVYCFLQRRRPDHRLADFGIVVLKGLFAAAVFWFSWKSPARLPALIQAAFPFLWLAMIADRSAALPPWEHFTRKVLVSLAVLQILLIYPVAGTQMSFAALLTVLVAAVCLSDVLRRLAEWLPARACGYWPRLVGSVLPALIVLAFVVQDARALRQKYLALTPLELAGARRIRLPERQVATYRFLDYNLRAHADTFVTMPGINSLYFWTEKVPVNGINVTTWMNLLNDTQQQRVRDDLSKYPRACAVCLTPTYRMWVEDLAADGPPLVRSFAEDFRTIGTVSRHEFMVRRQRVAPELLYCVHPVNRDCPDFRVDENGTVPFDARKVPWSTEFGTVPDGATTPWVGRMVLPAIRGRSICRMSVFDSETGETLAETDSHGPSGSLAVFHQRQHGPDTTEALAGGCIELDRPRRLLLKIRFPGKIPQRSRLLVRLFDRQGAVFASIPFLQ